MREIKFRAWDGKQMHRVWSFYENKVGMFFHVLTDRKNPEHMESLGRAYICKELMQYTGLSDKTGKEIYEGDLYRDRQEMLYEVIYVQAECCFVLSLVSDSPVAELRRTLEFLNMSIMNFAGNIYENPELLGGE